jgi:hypothetical protein
MNRIRMKMNVIYACQTGPPRGYSDSHTFMPYCSFAIIGLSEMKVKSLRRHVKGRGTMRAQKMSISVTRRRKT